MEETKVENIEGNRVNNSPNKSQAQIAGAIIIAGLLIAGAVLLKDSSKIPTTATTDLSNIKLDPVNAQDRVLGDPKAKVTVVAYEDFQCPWCGKFHGEAEKDLRDTYIPTGKVQFVYRDYPFLGTFVKPYVVEKDESINAAQGARCAGDQGKFWEYHDYLLEHQNGENEGNFTNKNLKTFAQTLGLDSLNFDQCLDSNKYAAAISDSIAKGSLAGVNGTPYIFILKNGKIFDTISGYVPSATFTAKIDAALK